MLNERSDTKLANLDSSVLAKLIDLKRSNPQPTSGKLGKDYDLKIDRELQITTIEELPEYQHEHLKWGMPYAMPGLSLKEEHTLKQWLQEGSKVELLPPIPSQTVQAVAKWKVISMVPLSNRNWFSGIFMNTCLSAIFISRDILIMNSLC